MVGHQHIGVDQTAVFGGCFGEPVTVVFVVFDVEEDRAAIVAALDHVQRLVGQEIAAVPSHGGPCLCLLNSIAAVCGKIYSDPFSAFLR